MRKFSAQLRNQAKDDGILYQVEFSCEPIQEFSPGIDKDTGKKPGVDMETRKESDIVKEKRKMLVIWKRQLKELKVQYHRYKVIHRLKPISEKLIELMSEIEDLEFDIKELEKSMGGQKDD